MSATTEKRTLAEELREHADCYSVTVTRPRTECEFEYQTREILRRAADALERKDQMILACMKAIEGYAETFGRALGEGMNEAGQSSTQQKFVEMVHVMGLARAELESA